MVDKVWAQNSDLLLICWVTFRKLLYSSGPPFSHFEIKIRRPNFLVCCKDKIFKLLAECLPCSEETLDPQLQSSPLVSVMLCSGLCKPCLCIAIWRHYRKMGGRKRKKDLVCLLLLWESLQKSSPTWKCVVPGSSFPPASLGLAFWGFLQGTGSTWVSNWLWLSVTLQESDNSNLFLFLQLHRW